MIVQCLSTCILLDSPYQQIYYCAVPINIYIIVQSLSLLQTSPAFKNVQDDFTSKLPAIRFQTLQGRIQATRYQVPNPAR